MSVKGRPNLVDELPVRLRRVQADAQHYRVGLADRLLAVAQAAGLLGTARGVILWIKIENDNFPFKVRELDLLPRLGDGSEIRRGLALRGHGLCHKGIPPER